MSVTRSTVNQEQYAAPEHQTSGFNLSYSRHSSYMLGRMHIGGYHYTMPGDKISGKSLFNGTFNRIQTPMVTPVKAMSYTFFTSLRALDNTFERGTVPTKLNAMAANWNAPTTNTRYLVDQLLRAYFGMTPTDTVDTTVTLGQLVAVIRSLSNGDVTLENVIGHADAGIDEDTFTDWLYSNVLVKVKDSLTTGILFQMAKKMYIDDALLDIWDNIENKLGTLDNPISESIMLSEFVSTILDVFLTPWLGRYSYYGEFKYPYVRPQDIYKIVNNLVTTSANDYNGFLDLFSDEPKSEYALRAMYVIWYEHFRNVDLEPVSTTLPDWHDFGSASILDVANGGNLCYLIYRIRSWEKDMFTTAQIDDISRHVYAPIVTGMLMDGQKMGQDSVPAISSVSYSSLNMNNKDAGNAIVATNYGSLPTSYDMFYIDNESGELKSIYCPVPSNINDYLSSIDQTFSDVYGLDLNSLRQAQQLQRYLKRNYVFGDEYKDRLLAHYNSRLSDMRINRPEIISRQISDYNMEQEVSNVSTSEMNVGDRTATATINLPGNDGYSMYGEEFGLVVNLMTFVPTAQYDGDEEHHSLTKQIHFPLPEFAVNNEEFGRKREIAGTALTPSLVGSESDNRYMFGRYPAYHIWRSRVDEVGGMFLDEMQDCTFRRFWGNYSLETTPKLGYYFLHIRPNLGMFANTNLYDCQIYGSVYNECFVERVLPTPVEVI